MDFETRKKISEANRGRQLKCARCGSTATTIRPGSELEPSSHFPDLTYKVCNACGHEVVTRARRKR